MRWSLFFLIAVGRGKMLQPITPEQGETCINWVFDLSEAAPFAIKTTEAPSYRRGALNRMREAGRAASQIQQTPVYRGFGIRDGHGIVFVSNQEYIYPAGFLPLVAGSVRRTISSMYIAIRRSFALCKRRASSEANAAAVSTASCAAALAHAPLPIPVIHWPAIHSALTNRGTR
jgi:MoaA/NifB/PqqE/SkfB family radical SAM enzyme